MKNLKRVLLECIKESYSPMKIHAAIFPSHSTMVTTSSSIPRENLLCVKLMGQFMSPIRAFARVAPVREQAFIRLKYKKKMEFFGLRKAASADDFLHHFTMNIGQAIFSTLKAVMKLFMIHA